eukprot:366438-Chlamydomonas_euryale.AAC.1
MENWHSVGAGVHAQGGTVGPTSAGQPVVPLHDPWQEQARPVALSVVVSTGQALPVAASPTPPRHSMLLPRHPLVGRGRRKALSLGATHAPHTEVT